MKKNRTKIIVISSIVLIILGLIIGTTRALANDILLVCDKTELLPNESTTCHVTGVSQKSISAIEFHLSADSALAISKYTHSVTWDNYHEEFGEIVMFTSDEFINTFEVLSFTLTANDELGNYKIYLKNGKMIENDEYTTKETEPKELNITITNNPTNNSSSSSNKPGSSTNTNTNSEAKPNSSSLVPSTSNSGSSQISTNSQTNSTKTSSKNNTISNPNTGTSLILVIVLIGVFAIAYSTWYKKKIYK